MSFFDPSLEGSYTDLGGAGNAPMGGKLPAYMNACGVEVSAGNNANNGAPAPAASPNGWSFLTPKPSSPGMGG